MENEEIIEEIEGIINEIDLEFEELIEKLREILYDNPNNENGLKLINKVKEMFESINNIIKV